ncbi:hypothetical protein [Halomicrobium salinisoli]|uniref:hypothetical protein n=1 Tax=Halomicrobium salinisoli TaxID=2878391 RepID=UPI001CEFFCA4|nr:hypothetical protein [Halomicrobium salinisoli]
MSSQPGLVLESTAYDEVTKAIEQLREEGINDNHRVIWKTETRDFGATNYTIEKFGSKLGESTMHIIGGRGGQYEIIPKPNDSVWIKYKDPDPSRSGWEEELTQLAILTPEFEYVHEEGWRAFFSDAFQIIEEVRDEYR